ncbi:MAG: Swt1 family HEPN domain-containing protein [Ignavibacteriales bacterium]
MSKDIYAYVFKGELTKSALEKTPALKRHSNSMTIDKEIAARLPLELLDDEYINKARQMATVYVAIAAFENATREFIIKVLMENLGDTWWENGVSEKIRSRAEGRKQEEEKIKWHTQRGDNSINYTEMGDLVSIISQNQSLFEPYIDSLEWARQIMISIERSRNVIMHSGELGMQDIERIGTLMRDWINQVGA